MKNFSTYLLICFMGVFWLLRLVAAVANELGQEVVGLTVLNMNLEVLLLFTTLLCFLLIVKRKIVGALIYLLTYGLYFGTDIYNTIVPIILDGQSVELSVYMSLTMSIIGVILPIVILFDLLLDQNSKKNPVDKKTDWFYKNEKFDRELDERADKNNYRTL